MKPEIISLDDLQLGDRQRKEFKEKDLLELANSIEEYGLIHAPVVDQSNNLIAGERRIRAIRIIKERKASFKYGEEVLSDGQIPVHRILENDPKVLFAIELEENIRRVNLSAIEEATAIAQLHSFRQSFNPAQTMKDTAQEVANLQGKEANTSDSEKVANSILVDQFKDDKEIQAAAKTSLKKAAKMARKKMELELVAAIGRIEANDGKLKKEQRLEVIHGDSQILLPKLPANSFDALIFDPPYGKDADSFSDQAFGLGHQYNDSPEEAMFFTGMVIKEATKFLKPESHILMFCAYEFVEYWRKIYEANGFWVWPRPLIWDKGNQAHNPVPGYGPKYSYECILFAGRGKREINKTVRDVFNVSPPRDKIHAAEKPVELMSELIEFVAHPGDKLIDPCCGSGPILAAGRGKEVKITAIELSEAHAAIAKERAKE